MSSDQKIEAVLFDMDGLLLDSERLCMECFVHTRRFFGLSDGREIFLRTIGLRPAISDALISDSLEGSVDFATFRDIWRTRLATLSAQGIPLRPGVSDLFKALSAMDIPLAVATSADTEKAIHHLQDADLLSHFEVVIGGDKVSRHKPDPEVYLAAAATLGANPARCIAFEDSDPGTQAAFASGARVVQVPDLKQPTAAVQSLGHIIAPDILSGAVAVGLISPTQHLKRA